MIYYKSIEEFPLWNWRKCSDGDLTFCRTRKNIGTKAKDEAAFDVLQDQHIARFGLGEDHERIIELRMERAELQLDYCIDGNAFLLNRTRVIKEEINDILERTTGGASVDECLMALSKWMGYRIDQKVVSIVEFQTYLKQFQTEAKAQQSKSA